MTHGTKKGIVVYVVSLLPLKCTVGSSGPMLWPSLSAFLFLNKGQGLPSQHALLHPCWAAAGIAALSGSPI